MSEESWDKLDEGYAAPYPLRSLAQLVPRVGGAIDALVGGRGAQIQMNRLAVLIEELRVQLSNEEHSFTTTPEDSAWLRKLAGTTAPRPLL